MPAKQGGASVSLLARKLSVLIALSACASEAFGEAVFTSEPAARPAGPRPSDILSNSGIELKGYIDVAAQGSDLKTGGNPYKVNDVDHANLTLQGIGLTVDKLPKEGFGGLAYVLLGKDANLYKAYDYSQTQTTYFDFPQVFVQYADGPLTVQLGKFATLMGLEVFDSTANPNYSHSLNYGEYPYTHTGVRATYAVSATTSLIAGINNGWDQMKDVNAQKTLELGLTSSAIKPFTIAATIYSGVEPVLAPANYRLSSYATPAGVGPGYGTDANAQGNRFMFDTVITYAAAEALTLIVNGTYAMQRGAVYLDGSTHEVQWYGAAFYVNYQIDRKSRLSLRLEEFKDQDGYKTWLFGAGSLGTCYRDDEATLTYGYAAADDFEWRAEARFDAVNRDGVFSKPDGSSTRTGISLGLQGIYKF
jgi:hypothetical protein